MSVQVSEIPPYKFKSKFTVVGAIIEYDKKFLYLKRHPEKNYGLMWGFPGGKVEKNESKIDGVLREVVEETGLNLEKNSTIHLRKFYVRYPRFDFTYDIYLHRLNELPKEILLSKREHVESAWFSFEEASQFPLLPGEEICMEKIKSKLIELISK